MSASQMLCQLPKIAEAEDISSGLHGGRHEAPVLAWQAGGSSDWGTAKMAATMECASCDGARLTIYRPPVAVLPELTSLLPVSMVRPSLTLGVPLTGALRSRPRELAEAVARAPLRFWVSTVSPGTMDGPDAVMGSEMVPRSAVLSCSKAVTVSTVSEQGWFTETY